MKKLVDFVKKDNSQVLAGNLLASLFGLLNFMMMVRMTSKSDFGLIVIFLSAAGLTDLVRTGFVRQGLVRHWVTNNEGNKKPLIGSAWMLHILIGSFIGLLCYTSLAISSSFSFDLEGFTALIHNYPLLLLASIPHQMESWLAQGKKKYLTMNMFRLGVNILFFIALALNFGSVISVNQVIEYLIICNAVVSLVSLVYYKSIKEIVHTKWHQVVSLFNFGKYSLSTLAGSNLLKSTDTLLIGLMINSESAAVYAIPFKVIELLEIPLRGFVMTSFHALTQSFKKNERDEYTRHFQTSVFRLSIAFLPIILISLFLPGFVIELLGGSNYGESIYVLQVLSFAMFLLPADKFAGMALDSNNQPKVNAQKVWIMVIINLIGDLVVISLNGSLWMIATVTILNILFGVCYGILKNNFLRFSNQIKWSQLLHI
ncbi:MAG: O-antigen/teichoic acid export membrane protein [Cyclobacteriaceae bacterium]|jgi:O-antigen/teichoic acid export membrane protein